MPMAATATARRAAILSAALAVFLENGVFGATVEDICARSGASVGSLYHHYGDKQGLAGAVYVDALAGFQHRLVATLREHGDAEEGVRAGVAAYLRWCL